MSQGLPLIAIALLVSPDDPVLKAPGDQIPVEVKAMLDAAIASGNEGEVNTLVKYVQQVKMPSSDRVARLAQAWKNDRAASAQKRMQEADFLTLVKGRVELGGFTTSGNTSNSGVTGRVEVKREGLNWRHKLLLQADYQESFGLTSRERYVASYEPNYKVDDRLYVYGATQYESDRFLGYINRYSASSGAGYSAIRRTGMRLDLELGPAYRYTDYTDDTSESNVAARGSLAFEWKVSPRIELRQNASAYLQSANSTISSNTALNAKVLGPLSAQLSYIVQYESMPPVGRVDTDTTSRASLVYEF
ncbi:DUF481 domain-containing protein [Sphingomonas sp. S1-29]|uniref:DUF481 domain-containing protein n=1 Tax=Sphingomonas sp. S1-29 TaxID=2991074 RepID=UPI00223F3BA5|nr:DUF481 domain-containing protein [Sphingomonas sp. S1-29]UZK69718.1 DUF481 domain-containing protein [Sphingomonas sp. S1-29]